MLFAIPNELLVPLEGLLWRDGEHGFEADRRGAALTREQSEMLDRFLEIYNACDKPATMRAAPTVILAQDAELAGRMQSIRRMNLPLRQSLAEHFIATRACRNSAAPGAMSGQRYLMPLIDFMNHSHSGAEYRHTERDLQVTVRKAADSDECMLCYSRYIDPLGIAIDHGYVDQGSPYAASTPVMLDIAGFGRLEIVGRALDSNSDTKPPKPEFREDGLALSHLIFNAAHPLDALAHLKLTMTASGMRRGLDAAMIEKAIPAALRLICAENKARLDEFCDYLATRGELDIAPVLTGAAHRQLENLKLAVSRALAQ